jgi:predicted HAD superfamily Cof-like phosphohydrolase
MAENFMSHYQSVAEFNSVSEAKTISMPTNIFEDMQILEFRISLIKEEINEFYDAIKNKDYIEVVDALADILYVAHGMCNVIKFEPKSYFSQYYNIKSKQYKILADMLRGFSSSLNNISLRDSDEHKKIYKAIFQITLENKPTAEHIFQKDLTDYCYSLLKNELDNVIDSVKIFKNELYLKDHLVNLLNNTYKVAFLLNVNIDKAFKIVHESNMTKFCSSEEEAKDTVEYYKSIPADSPKYYDSPTYKKAKSGDKWIVYNESTSKTLKNINYTPADLSCFAL